MSDLFVVQEDSDGCWFSEIVPVEDEQEARDWAKFRADRLPKGHAIVLYAYREVEVLEGVGA